MSLLFDLMAAGGSAALAGEGISVKRAPAELLERLKAEKETLRAEIVSHDARPVEWWVSVLNSTASRLSYEGLDCRELLDGLAKINQAFQKSFDDGLRACVEMGASVKGMAFDLAKQSPPEHEGPDLYKKAVRIFKDLNAEALS